MRLNATKPITRSHPFYPSLSRMFREREGARIKCAGNVNRRDNRCTEPGYARETELQPDQTAASALFTIFDRLHISMIVTTPQYNKSLANLELTQLRRGLGCIESPTRIRLTIPIGAVAGTVCGTITGFGVILFLTGDNFNLSVLLGGFTGTIIFPISILGGLLIGVVYSILHN